MTKRYASMPLWLYTFYGVTEEMDKTAFRQHDHDYGGKGLLVEKYQGKNTGYVVSKTRNDADIALYKRLVSLGLNCVFAFQIYLGCRLTLADRWKELRK